MSSPRIELGTSGMLASFSHHYITTLIRQTPEKFNHLTDCLTITSIIDDRIPIPNLSANLT